LEYKEISADKDRVDEVDESYSPFINDSQHATPAFDDEAYKKDEGYWDTVRAIPITLKDTIKNTIQFNKEKYKPTNFWIGKIILGDYIQGNDTSKISIRYSGLKRVFWDYNYVDGFWIGQRFEIKNKISKNRSLEVYPYIYYLTARQRMIGGSYIAYDYSLRNKAELYFLLVHTLLIITAFR
jgi:hypothetical protein